jgi:hypothetical protein
MIMLAFYLYDKYFIYILLSEQLRRYLRFVYALLDPLVMCTCSDCFCVMTEVTLRLTEGRSVGRSVSQYVEVEVEVTLRLTVSMSWHRVPLWDLRQDIISCRNVDLCFYIAYKARMLLTSVHFLHCFEYCVVCQRSCPSFASQF